MRKTLDRKLSRRKFLGTTAASGAALAATGTGLSRVSFAAGHTIKIGFLAPFTGPVAAWGKPGYDGCLIWADWVNAKGGVKIGDKSYRIEFVGYDNEYDAGKAKTGATKLIKEDGVKFIMMLGGDTWPGVEKIAEREGMLFSRRCCRAICRRTRRRSWRRARCIRSTTSPASNGWRRTRRT